MITVKGRELIIPEGERYIGTPYDDNSEIRTFQIDRTGMNGVDLSALSFRLDLEYKGGKKDTALLTKTVDEEKIVLLWNITNGVLQEAGTLFVNIRATDTLGTVKWASFPAAMYVEKTIDTPGSYDGSLTELEQMEAEIDKKMEQMDAWADSVDSQEEIRQENEQVRQSQEEIRQKNEIEREKKTQEVINTFGEAIGEAKDAAKLSESWAVGETGIRPGENENNSKYYCSQSQAEADRAKEEADKAAAFSEIVPPVFRINWETMELIQETAATGIRFFLTEDKELCFEFTKEEQGGGEDAAADHMQIWKNKDDIQKNQAYIATLTDKTNTLAPGIVLDARGKQIIISDASEQPFVGLNVYGKSTQVKTTGVNLANGMDNVYKKEQSGQQKPNYCYCWGYTLGGGPLILDKPLKAGTYTFSFYSDANASIYLAKAPYVTGQFVQYSVNQKVTGDIKNGFQRYFCPFQLTDERDLIGIYSEGYTTCFGGMINFGDKPLPYEPYTGGKPSPSPEYPQEIANAGDNGNIKVEVTGRNLFPLIEDNIVKNSPLTATINSDGSISIYGTPLKRYESVFTTQLIDFHPGTYYLGGGIFEKGKLIVQLNIARNDDSVEYISNKSFELKKDDKKRSLSIQYSNAELIPVNQIIYPLLVYGAENVPFEPYKPAQTLTLKTPNGLAGIPTKGNGNYTDENGQQWICDTIECRDGIAEYVQRIGEIVVNSDAHIAADLADYGALQENTVIGRYFNESIKKETAILCKELQIIENWSNDKESARTVEKGIDFRLSRERIGLGTETTNEQNKTAILKFLETTPLHFVVQLDTPIRTPLTQEEMAAYKALHTYSPNTTVVNDAGCGMSLTYIADTQRYIDKKIAAISAAE